MPLLTTPLPLQNSIYSKLKLIFLGCILLLSTNLLGRDYFYPKQEGGKWGIYMHYQVYDKKEGTQDREKWLFKPKWDMVWFDTSRCITTGNGCDGFITFKRGKYGYAWSN